MVELRKIGAVYPLMPCKSLNFIRHNFKVQNDCESNLPQIYQGEQMAAIPMRANPKCQSNKVWKGTQLVSSTHLVVCDLEENQFSSTKRIEHF